ncbi:hypothetical protein H7347_07830 [Corynebacterium sp. zg-331]|uniref:hypothetical protein n=1 Tax=unclassified Corynebacterium TaxID=2624378 RepID=UPI00128C22AC|nr:MULTISPECIES: hypothetical protein [unclassified Corynebacterium]MBC3186476.1 hypothetical protein [Corynebacterium sp. zg-331]MPV52961.1 hypothetical protein [Corynebacterium sp. zg331]
MSRSPGRRGRAATMASRGIARRKRGAPGTGSARLIEAVRLAARGKEQAAAIFTSTSVLIAQTVVPVGRPRSTPPIMNGFRHPVGDAVCGYPKRAAVVSMVGNQIVFLPRGRGQAAPGETERADSGVDLYISFDEEEVLL